MSERPSAPYADATIVPVAPCDLPGAPYFPRCPEWELCKRDSLYCQAFREYLRSKAPENALMHRQVRMKKIPVDW